MAKAITETMPKTFIVNIFNCFYLKFAVNLKKSGELKFPYLYLYGNSSFEADEILN